MNKYERSSADQDVKLELAEDHGADLREEAEQRREAVLVRARNGAKRCYCVARRRLSRRGR